VRKSDRLKSEAYSSLAIVAETSSASRSLMGSVEGKLLEVGKGWRKSHSLEEKEVDVKNSDGWTKG